MLTLLCVDYWLYWLYWLDGWERECNGRDGRMDGKGMGWDSYLAATLVVVVVCRVLDTWRMGETYIFFVINYPLQLNSCSCLACLPDVCVLN